MENDILDALEDLGWVLFTDLFTTVCSNMRYKDIFGNNGIIVHVYMYCLIRELVQSTVQCFEQNFNIFNF